MSKNGKPKQEEQGSGPPAWIVSFTDMITLLLSFFIMLQAFAHVQDDELFFIGRDSFKRAIAGLGIPGILFGKDQKAEFDNRKPKHSTKEAKHEIPRNRVLDAEDEEIRQAFDRLRRNMETKSSDPTVRTLVKRVVDVKFAPFKADLDNSAKEHLVNLAINLKQVLSSGAPVTVYVIGAAGDVDDRKQQWLVSAGRAEAAGEFLKQACLDPAGSATRPQNGWTFFYWGAGAATNWTKTMGTLPEQPHIIIVVTEEST